MIIEIILCMFGLGLILGFVGAGGSGFIIALLSTLFGFSIHTALGTALAAMAFTTLSGAYSHFREGNVFVRVGVVVGLFGAIGSGLGSKVGALIPSQSLQWLTAGMLILSGLILGLRMFVLERFFLLKQKKPVYCQKGHRFWILSAVIGLITGFLSGTFGIGSTPFIQIGLMIVLGMPIQLAVGTTMLIILPIAFVGGLGYFAVGYLDLPLLAEVVIGTMSGSYIGAKLTRRLPRPVLKTAMFFVPIIAGIILIS